MGREDSFNLLPGPNNLTAHDHLSSGPQHFWPWGPGNFPRTGRQHVCGMIQALHLLHFISIVITSAHLRDYQILDVD